LRINKDGRRICLYLVRGIDGDLVLVAASDKEKHKSSYCRNNSKFYDSVHKYLTVAIWLIYIIYIFFWRKVKKKRST